MRIIQYELITTNLAFIKSPMELLRIRNPCNTSKMKDNILNIVEAIAYLPKTLNL